MENKAFGILLSAFVLMCLFTALADENCYTDAYNNTICGVTHYLGINFDGNSTAVFITGSHMSVIDENQNTFGTKANAILIETNVTEHSVSLLTPAGNNTWDHFICSAFEGNSTWPITLKGDNLTVADVGMKMPNGMKVRYSVNYTEKMAYVDLVK